MAAVLAAAVAMGCERGGSQVPAAVEAEPREMAAVLWGVAVEARATSVFTGEETARTLRAELERRAPSLTARDRLGLLRWLAFHELRLGEFDAAVARLEEAHALLPALAGTIDEREATRVRFELAVAYLRLGESRNCVARHSSESCILPIRGRGVHENQEGSRKGMAKLRDVLAREPGNLTARWLLNVAAMTVGEYPEGVPAELAVPPERFASEERFPRFADVADRAGLAVSNLAGGLAVDDFDGDAAADVVLSSSDPGAPLRFFAGRGDGTFVERGREAGLDSSLGGFALAPADYDGDGDLDLLVLRGAWLQRSGRHPKSLLENDGKGRFSDVTFAAGLGEVHYPSQAAAWADYDGDGDLDLYVGNEWSDNFAAPSQLFQNRGDGTFVDVAPASGVTNDRMAKGVVWGDFDGDGRPDLYVSNLNGWNRLYVNRGDGTFADVAEERGVAGPWASYPVVAFDADQDGNLDLLVGAYTVAHEPWTATARPAVEDYVASLLGLPHRAELPRLYLGDGRGGFRDASADFGLSRVVLASAIAFGDLEGDGFPDVYLATGYPGYEGLMPNVMLRNRRGTRFADVTTAGGFGHLQKAHSLAIADLDGDGDEDVLLHAGGMFPGDAFVNAAFENPGSGAGWIEVRLAGARANRFGVGSRIRAGVVEDGVRRSIHRWVGVGAGTGAAPLATRIGIGRASEVERLEVTWPGSTGAVQVVGPVRAGESILVHEP